MKVFTTAALTLTLCVVGSNDGWSPGPADLKAPLSDKTGATANVVGPSNNRRIHQGRPLGAQESRFNIQQFKNGNTSKMTTPPNQPRFKPVSSLGMKSSTPTNQPLFKPVSSLGVKPTPPSPKPQGYAR